MTNNELIAKINRLERMMDLLPIEYDEEDMIIIKRLREDHGYGLYDAKRAVKDNKIEKLYKIEMQGII